MSDPVPRVLGVRPPLLTTVAGALAGGAVLSQVAHPLLRGERLRRTTIGSVLTFSAASVLDAARRGGTPIDFAVNWVLNNAAISSVIAGPRTYEQWIQYFSYTSYAWSTEDEAFIDGHVRTGHPSTPGFNDPSYPIEGRFPTVR